MHVEIVTNDAIFRGVMNSVTSMVNSPKVLVMMATFNGAAYLEDQIESVLSQRGVDVSLRVRDDCSDDETLSILENYSRAGAPVSARRNEHRLGVAMNFMQMVYGEDLDEYDYFAFSDQDDVWLPDKLITAIRTIEETEKGGQAKELEGIGTPVLYCSEIMNVDEKLENPVPELASLEDDTPYRASLLIRNRYSGCTMVFNRAHLMLARRVPQRKFYRIHDTWMALLAYYCGNFVIDRSHALILRRITGKNSEGAITVGSDMRNASLARLRVSSDRFATKTAKELLVGYGCFMSTEDRALVDSFVTYASSFFSRMKWALSNNYRSLSGLDTMLVRAKFLFGRY